MTKKIVISSVAIFIAIALLDCLMHCVVLKSSYEATASLWRPMEEMERLMPWMYLITLIVAAVFSLIYAWLIAPKSIAIGVKFGSLLGLMIGVSMGFGSYLVMPITLFIALVWCVGTLVEFAVAGLIAAAIIK